MEVKNKLSKVFYNILMVFFVVLIVVSGTLIGLKVLEGRQITKEATQVAKEYTQDTGIKVISGTPSGLDDVDDPAFWEENGEDDPDATIDPNDPDATPKPTRDPNRTPKPTLEPQSYEIPTIGVDFAGLHKINPDVVGWLYLPDSVINYPIVRPTTAYNSNYYLSHTFDHKENIAGSLFVDSGSGTFQVQNSMIHGHRMNNGSMFGALNKYKTQSYYNKHNIMQLYTPDGDYLIYVFAAFTAEVAGYESSTVFNSDEEFQAYIDHCVNKSVIKSSFSKPNANSEIVTLSTCVVQKDTERFMVLGYLGPA